MISCYPPSGPLTCLSFNLSFPIQFECCFLFFHFIRFQFLACKREFKGSDPWNLIRAFLRDKSGATAIEYGLIAAGIAVAIIAVVKGMGPKLSATFTKVSNTPSIENRAVLCAVLRRRKFACDSPAEAIVGADRSARPDDCATL